MVMYIVPPYRPHRSLIGQPIIGVGSMSSFATYSPSSSGSSPTSGSSYSSDYSSRSRRTKTYYPNELSSSSSSRYAPCPPAYNNKRLRRRDAFGIGEARTYTTAAAAAPASRRTEMPIERILAVVREDRGGRSKYDDYHHHHHHHTSLYDGDDYDYYSNGGSGSRDHHGREYRYSRRHGENRLRSFSEHARSSGRRDLIDYMGYAFDDVDDGIGGWERYCRSC